MNPRWLFVEHLVSPKEGRDKRREDMNPFWECHDCGQPLYTQAYKVLDVKRGREILLGHTCVEKVTGLSVKELRKVSCGNK